MTEQEARAALEKAFWEYMAHPAKERDNYYQEYREKKEKIKRAYAKTLYETRQNETKTK